MNFSGYNPQFGLNKIPFFFFSSGQLIEFLLILSSSLELVCVVCNQECWLVGIGFSERRTLRKSVGVPFVIDRGHFLEMLILPLFHIVQLTDWGQTLGLWATNTHSCGKSDYCKELMQKALILDSFFDVSTWPGYRSQMFNQTQIQALLWKQFVDVIKPPNKGSLSKTELSWIIWVELSQSVVKP